MFVTGSEAAGSGTLRFAFDNRLLHHYVSWQAPHSLIPTGYYLCCRHFLKYDTLLMDGIRIGGLDKYPFFEHGVSRTRL